MQQEGGFWPGDPPDVRSLSRVVIAETVVALTQWATRQLAMRCPTIR